MKTIENNKLIAEFMGGKLHKNWTSKIYPKPKNTIIFPVGKQPTKDACCLWCPEQLQYHLFWDWLMPVIDKCREKDPPMTILEYNQYIMASFDYLDIEKTYKAVIEFIEWYNKEVTP